MRKRKEERKKEKRIWAVPSGITRWRRNTGNGVTVPNSPWAGEEIAKGVIPAIPRNRFQILGAVRDSGPGGSCDWRLGFFIGDTSEVTPAGRY